MKSTIKIDIAGTEPVIRITREDTSDLRDKFIGSFLERLQHSSNLCFIEYTGTPGIWDIHALPPNGDNEYCQRITMEQSAAMIPQLYRNLCYDDICVVHRDICRKIVGEWKEKAQSTSIPLPTDCPGNILRRCRVDLMTPAELSIYTAIQEVEKVGADPRLTDIVNMLSTAKDLLSDYVESHLTPTSTI